MDTKKQMRQIHNSLRFELKGVSDLVMKTPTGQARNALCDAHIHLIAAMNKIEEAFNHTDEA
jgi:hypothetical protein